MKTKCPHCDAKFKAPSEYEGKKIKCPKCKEPFVVAEFVDVRKAVLSKRPPELGRRSAEQSTRPQALSSVSGRPAPGGYGSEHSQTLRVVPTKTTSGFGIAALVLGIIACLTCWIPFVGLLVIPLGILGVVFGFIGILASAIGRRSYIGLPVSGMVVSLIAVIIAVTITGAITGAVSEAIDEVLDTRDLSAQPSGGLSELDDDAIWSTPVKPVDEGSRIEKVDKEAQKIKEKQAYVRSVELYDVRAKYYKTYFDEETAGVEFKIRNKGNKTLSEVKVTVYFKDAFGRVIGEEDYYPVLSSSYSFGSNKPLKPNYIWQMERGKFYKAESVPDEWQEGNVVARITDIEFQE